MRRAGCVPVGLLHAGDVVLDDPFQALVIGVVLILHVVIGQRDSEYVLVEGPREVGVQQLAVVQSLRRLSSRRGEH